MNFKKNLYYICLTAFTLILIAYLAIDYFTKENNTSTIPTNISQVNTSYKNLIDSINYNIDDSIVVAKENLNIINSLDEKNKDYSELISSYKNYLTSFIILKDTKKSISDYIIVINENLVSLEEIKNYYLNNSNTSKIKNFESFYSYNRNLLLKELEASKKSLNSEVTNSINSDYSYSMNKFYTNLTTICQDLTPALERCYSNKTSLDNILNDIYIKQGNIKNLKEEITNISIPPEYYSSFEELQQLLKLCTIYLDSMREVLVTESSSPSYEKELKDIYENPFSKYEDLTIKLTEYAENNSSIIK